MPDFPNALIGKSPDQVITPFSDSSIGPDLIGGISTASNASPQANRAWFYPFSVKDPVTIMQLGWLNGITVSGNCDCGIYDLAGNRLISTGSTADAGTSSLQVVDVADTDIPPGYYFLAFAVDNTSANLNASVMSSLSLGLLWSCGIMQQDTAFPLPATATFAKLTAKYMAHCCAIRKAVV
jgi:hypothetical protein